MTIPFDIDVSSPLIKMAINGESKLFQLSKRIGAGLYKLRFFGTVYQLKVLEEFASQMSKLMPVKQEVDMSSLVLAPMPGVLKSVDVKPGDMVAEGQEVCVLEAMKMQNSLTSARIAKVKKVNYKQGQTVDEGDVIVEFE
ncbi:propionyl-CoA carboxylase alpha chain, mitochondrial-like [Saccostrea cucullata]|uniref:propionyl-CoA carboxylase alpha chain, mitochondrial-like n=1 Tax=Saccostrea cuccullata TaxID=36930 RepID=UPI002ED5E694